VAARLRAWCIPLTGRPHHISLSFSGIPRTNSLARLWVPLATGWEQYFKILWGQEAAGTRTYRSLSAVNLIHSIKLPPGPYSLSVRFPLSRPRRGLSAFWRSRDTSPSALRRPNVRQPTPSHKVTACLGIGPSSLCSSLC